MKSFGITRSFATRWTKGLRAGLVVAATGALFAACDDSPAAPRGLATITVSPATASTVTGATQQYTAVGASANGDAISVTPTWSVVAGGGSVSSTGLFTAGPLAGIFPGTVQASSGAISGTASATVTAGALSRITIAPTPAGLAINGTQQFAAVGRDAGNNLVAITPTWSVVAGGGAISSTGLFTAGATAGTFTNTVRATSGTISATATVSIVAGGLATITLSPTAATLSFSGTRQFTAVGRDAGNNVVAITPTWSVVASGGTISSGGLFTAGSVAGTFTNTVRATSGSIFGSATVSVSSGAGQSAVNLRSAGNYVILAMSAISNVPTSAITGDLGLSPAAASFITGFSLTLPAASPFATSSQVTGNVYASDYAVPTPSNLTTAIGDMQTAYTDAAGRPTPDFTELGTGNIGGLTLAPGLYRWSNTVIIPTDVTLNGSATDVWIFQIAGGITQSSATRVNLTGGALARNVFWQVAGAVEIGTTAHMQGVILSQTAIALRTGATANGRLMAQTAVSLSGNTVVQPAP